MKTASLMKKKLYVLTICLPIVFSAFSQNTSKTTESCTDTLFSITAAQLRTTVRIFSEHNFLRSENALLKSRIALLERSGKTKDYIMQSQTAQMDAMNEMIAKKNEMLTNSDAAIDALKRQVAAERKKRNRYILYGVGAGAVVAGVVMVVLK